MSTVTRRTSNPLAEFLDWLEGGASPSLKSFGLTPYVRIEDFVDNGEYVIRAEMPGIDPDKDVQVQVTGNVLTIRGERTDEEKTKNHQEFHYGAFSRSVTLPSGAKANNVEASYSDGVLEVKVPLDDSVAEPRTVSIQRTEA